MWDGRLINYNHIIYAYLPWPCTICLRGLFSAADKRHPPNVWCTGTSKPYRFTHRNSEKSSHTIDHSFACPLNHLFVFLKSARRRPLILPSLSWRLVAGCFRWRWPGQPSVTGFVAHSWAGGTEEHRTWYRKRTELELENFILQGL